MKTVLIIIGVTVLILIIKACMPAGQKPENETSRPSTNKKPSQLKPNDKLVIVKGVNYEDLKSALKGYCNMYNKEDFAALPRLVKLSDREFAITFPYDIEFELYCYFVNYIKYPMDIKYNPEVTAWTTTKETGGWITEKSANKKVMLFIAEDDNEHDNVFLTTEDNIGYKLGFAVGEEKQFLETPKKRYFTPPIDINTLTEKQAEDFQ